MQTFPTAFLWESGVPERSIVPVVRTSTTFVEPGRPTGTPAVMTTSSPSWRRPCATQVLMASRAATLISLISLNLTGVTPHHRANSLHVCWLGVRPSIGQSGRCLLIIFAVRPERDRQIIAGALTCLAMSTAAPLTASGTGMPSSSRGFCSLFLWLPQI